MLNFHNWQRLNSTIFKQETIKSWFTGVSTSVNNEVIQPFQNASKVIEDFNLARKNGELTTEKMKSLLEQSDVGLSNYLIQAEKIKDLDASMTAYNVSLQGSITGFSKVSAAIQQYNALGAVSKKEQQEFATAVGLTNSKLSSYLTGLNGSNAGLLGYGASLVGATAKTIGLTVATVALNAALTWGISAVVTGLITAFTSWINKSEEITEKAQEAADKINSITDTLKTNTETVENAGKRYAELAQEVENLGKITQSQGDLSNDEYEEFLDLSNQLASVFPSLAKNYDENGNAILNLSGNVDTIVDSLDNLIQKEKELTNQKIMEEFPDVFKGFVQDLSDAETDVKTAQTEFDKINQAYSSLEKGNSIQMGFNLNGYNKDTNMAMGQYTAWLETLGLTYEKINVEGGYVITAVGDIDEAFTSKLETARNNLQYAQEQLERQTSSVDSYLNTWLQSEYTYNKIEDDGLKTAIQDLVFDFDWDNLPEGIAKKFENGDWNAVSEYLRRSILFAISKVQDDPTISKALSEVFTNDDLTPDEKIGYIKQIQDYFGEGNIITVSLTPQLDDTTTLQKQYESAIEQTKKQFEGDTSAATEALKTAQENLQDEYDKIEKWGLGDYAEQIKNGTIQSVFGNVDMDNRQVIDWTTDNIEKWKDALSDIKYYDEDGNFLESYYDQLKESAENGESCIDTVFGDMMDYIEGYDGITALSFSHIVNNDDGTFEFLGQKTAEEYLYGILDAAKQDGDMSIDHILELDKKGLENAEVYDAEGKLIGQTYVHGIISGFNENANDVSMLTHFAGDFGAVNIAEQAIEEAKKMQEDFDWDSWFKENSINTKEEIDNWLEIAQAANSAAEAKERYVQGSTFDNETTISFTEIISQIEALSEGLDQIDEIYADVKNKEDFDWSSLLNNDDFQETFKGCKETYDDFIKTVTSSPDDIEACQSAFDKLASEYIYNSGALDNLTDETRTATIEFLKQKGVANAVAVVDQALMRNKIDAMFATQDFSDATYEEIQALAEECGVTEEATGAWNAYFVQKLLDETYSGKGDILALNNVITALDLGTTAWQRYYAAKKDIEAISGATKRTGKSGTTYYEYEENGIKYSVSEDALKQKQEDLSKYYEEVSLELKELAEIDTSYTGGSNTRKDDNKSSSSKSYEKDFDFFERRITVLTEALDGLSASMENVFGASAKNTIVDAKASILTEEINNYTDAIKMYQAKADESLNKLDVSLREKIKNGAIEVSEFTGENGEAVVEAMEAYAGWATKVSECSEELQNLKKQLAQLELEKFNNIAEDYSNKFDLHGNTLSMIDKQIDLLEAAGQLVGESFYEEKIKQSNLQLEDLYAERQDLANQLASALTSGRVESGSEEWLEMVKTMSDLDEEILDTKKSVEELEDAILDIKWDTFDRVQTRFDELSDELENIVGLLETATDIEVSDGHGTWTDEAIASLGVYAQQYEMAKYRVEQYADAIEDLKREYNSGKYSATEYAEKLADLNSKQWDAVNSAQSMEDAIIELNKTRVNEEIDAINEAIDAYREYTESQKEALNAEKDLHDYQKTLKEKTKAITDIEKQLAAMQNDNSLSAIAKRKKLEEQLAEAKEDLAETEYEHSIESQIEALDKNLENYEKKRNDEITALEESLNDRETLISNSLETVRANSELIGEQIESIANEHGVKISESLIASWQSGEDAIASYGDTLSSNTSAFIGELESVEQKEWELQEQANQTSEVLAEAFSKKSDALVEEFNKACASQENLNNVTLALQNNLINTLEREYDVSGITSAMDSIADAASNAAKQLRNVREEQENADDDTDGEAYKKKYSLVDTRTGEVLESGLSASEAKASRVKYGGKGGTAQIQYRDKNNKTKVASFSNGGIVEDIEDASDGRALFKRLAQYLGEDNLVAVKNGEGILTPTQTQTLVDITPTLTSDKFVTAVQKLNVPDNVSCPVQNISYQYGSLVTVNGNVDNNNINKIKTLIKDELKATFTKFDRDFRYSGY